MLFLKAHTHKSLSTKSRDLYLVFILVTVENAVSHKYVVSKGNKMLYVQDAIADPAIPFMPFGLCGYSLKAIVIRVSCSVALTGS